MAYVTDPAEALKAAELLGQALVKIRSEHEKRRVAARILTEELERVNELVLKSKRSDPLVLPDPTSLKIPAWDEHRDSVAAFTQTSGRT